MIRLVLLGTVHRDPRGKTRLLHTLEQIRPVALSLEVSPASVRLRNEWGRQWLSLFRDRLGELSRDTGLSPSELMAGAGLRGVYEYLRLPYEYRAALLYAKQAACPVFLLDDSVAASAFLSQVEEELLTQRNIELLHQAGGSENLSDEVSRNYSRASGLIFSGVSEPASGPWLNDPEAWSEREAGLGQKLRLLHQGLVRREGKTLSGQDLVSSLIIAPEAVSHTPYRVTLRENGVHLYIGGWEHLIDDRGGRSLFTRLKDLAPERRLCYNHRGRN